MRGGADQWPGGVKDVTLILAGSASTLDGAVMIQPVRAWRHSRRARACPTPLAGPWPSDGEPMRGTRSGGPLI